MFNKFKFFKKSLKGKILLFNLTVGLISGIFVLSTIYFIGTYTLKKSIGSNFQQVAEATAANLETLINYHIEESHLLATSSSILSMVEESNTSYAGEDPQAIRQRITEIEDRWVHAQGVDAYLLEVLNNKASLYLKNFFSQHDQKAAEKNPYHAILVINQQGAVVAAIQRPNHYYYGNRTWWQEAYHQGQGKLFVGPIETDPEGKQKIFVISTPIMKDGKAIGVLSMIHNVDVFFNPVTTARVGKTGHTMLAGSNSNQVLFCPVHPLENHHLTSQLTHEIFRDSSGWTATQADVHYPGAEAINGYTPVSITFELGPGNFGDEKWYIFTSQDPKETYAPIYTLLAWISLAGFIGIGIFVFLGLLISTNIVRPIQELQKGAETIGGGNLNYRITLHTGDEIEDLANKFNKMANKLKLFYIGLEENVKEKGWKIEHQSKELFTLYSIAAILNKSLSLKELLNETLHKMLDVMEADAGIIWMSEELTGRLTITATRIQPLPPEAMKTLVELIHHLSQEILKTGKLWDSENISVDGRLEKFGPVETTFMSLVGIPLRSRNKVLGVLYVLHKSIHALTSREEKLLTSVGNQIGVAIEHALLTGHTTEKEASV
jgi:HAMP domain-containing protein